MSDLVGRTISHFRIDKLLGTGGMGAVYKATDIQLQRPVAIKIMHSQFAARTEFQQRFLQEARASAKLDHPNIIRTYAFDLEDTTLYMVVEFVSGGSLRDYLKTLYEARKFIEVREAIALTRQVAEALDYAHSQGMIHRDVKPDNILLKLVTSGGSEDMPFRAVLTDFGLAKLAEGGVQSISDNPMGTLPYMSPEQAQVEKLDGRTDLYALGVMLYELTTGRLPFMPRNIVEAIKMHTSVEPDKPSAVRANISKQLEDVILKGMAKKPDDRYQTGGDFARALRQLEAVSAPGTSAPPLVQAPPEQINSLSTYLQSMALPVEAPKGAIPAADASQTMDRIVIVEEGKAPRFISINKQTMTIGRDPDGDIVLTGEGVSRNHARIERRRDGQYQIMDIGSTNGTYLGEAKLLSNIPERWAPEKTVRIGRFYLSIQISQHTGTERQVLEVRRSADASVVSAGSFASPGGGAGEGAIQQAPARQVQPVGLTLNPPTVNVDAGGRASTTIEVLNQSDIVEHYRFQVQGVPAEWVMVPSSGIQLMPASKGSMPISFGPPRNPKSTAGAHNFDVRVSSEERGTELGRISGILIIAPYYQFDCDMTPKRIKNSGMAHIVINNRGNAPESFTVAARDREEAAHFDPPLQQTSVNPGLSETVPFFARAKNRPLLGGAKSLQLEFNTAAASGTDRTLNAELWVTPIIPAWIIPLLVMMCIICIAVILMLKLLVIDPQNTQLTASAGISSNRVTDAYNTLRPWLTGTAQQFDKRQTGTAIFKNNATATAVVIGTQVQQATQNRADTLTSIAKQDAGTATAASANSAATKGFIDTATSLAATLAKH